MPAASRTTLFLISTFWAALPALHGQDSQPVFPPSTRQLKSNAQPPVFPSSRHAAAPEMCPDLGSLPEPISQIWYSPTFGPALFENFVRQPDGTFFFTGKWQEKDHEEAGVIEEGVYDPQQSKVTFRYHQPWNGARGKAVFKLTVNANVPGLTGHYTHDGSFWELPWGSWTPSMVLVTTFDPQKACPNSVGMSVLTADKAGSSAANGTPTKVPKPGISGKEGAKDVPSWARGFRPYVTENGKEFAQRLMDWWYGEGNWESRVGPGEEFNRLRKWADRAFADP